MNDTFEFGNRVEADDATVESPEELNVLFQCVALIYKGS